MNRPSAETREHILDVATELFYWNGIRSTGVDKVAAEAGIAPTSLYRSFSSKDALVEAYVSRNDDAARDRAATALAAAGSDPRARILAQFDSLADEMDPSTCRGCSSQMALAEFADPGSPARLRAVRAKQDLLADFDALAADYCRDADRAPILAKQLYVIYEGLISTAMSGEPHRMIESTRSLVELVLDSVDH